MKKGLLYFAIIILTSMISGTSFGGDPKIGVIDLQRCLEESQEGKKAFEALRKKKDGLQKQLDEKQKEIMKLKEELEKQSMMLSMDAQEDKKRTIEKKARELEYLYQDLNKEMAEAKEEEKEKIIEELSKIVEEIGKEQNYLIILERRAGGVVYWTEAVDITETVIKAYDQMKKQSRE